MQIKVLFFAMIAQRLSQAEIMLELPEGATVDQALDALEAQHAALGEYRDGLATAVNMAYVKPTHVLEPGDELALIPPVSGG